MSDKAAHYNAQYQKTNFFGYREWLYDRYIAGLILACNIKAGASVLDVGCGQGFFSYLFQKHGMAVHGVDISEVGIRAAQRQYGQYGATFAVADIDGTSMQGQFDCVFVRGLSLYNREDFANNTEVTTRLLELVKPAGVLMFLYYSNCSSKKSNTWRYHSWEELRSHFKAYPNAQLYFSFKLDAWVLGKYTFTGLSTNLNRFLSKVSGKGGDFICILRKPIS